jgi:hypothetical protein
LLQARYQKRQKKPQAPLETTMLAEKPAKAEVVIYSQDARHARQSSTISTMHGMTPVQGISSGIANDISGIPPQLCMFAEQETTLHILRNTTTEECQKPLPDHGIGECVPNSVGRDIVDRLGIELQFCHSCSITNNTMPPPMSIRARHARMTKTNI